MGKSSFFGPETISLHTGYQPDPSFGSRAVPIYQTTSYVFETVDDAAALFNIEKGGHIYSRMTNPTVAVLEQRIAALEGGVGAICTASGMSALFVTFMSLCSAGDHIVSASQIYGSTATLLKHTLKRFNIECTFVSINDEKALKEAIQENTKLVFCESIGNPGLEVSDLPQIAKISHQNHLPLVVDATFATPVLCKPLDHGVDVVVQSVTEWISGHGLAVERVIVDSGSIEWGSSKKQPTLTTPYEPFHGINFWEEFGPSALSMKIRAESMRDFGPAMSPHSAFLFLQGIETLTLRMNQHVKNAVKLAKWLLEQSAVMWVNHPDLPENPTYEIAQKLFPNGAGSMLCFGVKGGREGGAAFINALKLASNLANVGDSRTLVLHPASTTHSRMDEEAMKAAGSSTDLIRVSVGIESVADIINDFKAGLKAVEKATS